MKTRFHASLAAAALACILASGCSPGPDAPPDADAPGADGGFIARQAARAVDKASAKLKQGNIPVGGSSIVINGHRYGGPRDAGDRPNAEITPDGDLLIAGEPVPATPAQRALLLEHRRHLEGVALAGMAIGAQGTGIAGTALTGLGEAVFGGEEGRKAYEERMEAEGRRIELEARKLCALLPALYESQQTLAASLPAFAPYATMTRSDVDDCGKQGLADAGADADADADAGDGVAH